jgi:NADH:ubiquinone oxidoreductase subunit 5 (subunit L)/multisubunit Na+/H+ antiporter MnhA subunit
MEGPTPISALIHAATMVTAGIFMVSRMSPLFELSDAALNFILIIGSITALFMAIGAMIGGRAGMMLALMLAVGMNFFSYWFSDKMVLKMYNAQEVDRWVDEADSDEGRRLRRIAVNGAKNEAVVKKRK